MKMIVSILFLAAVPLHSSFDFLAAAKDGGFGDEQIYTIGRSLGRGLMEGGGSGIAPAIMNGLYTSMAEGGNFDQVARALQGAMQRNWGSDGALNGVVRDISRGYADSLKAEWEVDAPAQKSLTSVAIGCGNALGTGLDHGMTRAGLYKENLLKIGLFAAVGIAIAVSGYYCAKLCWEYVASWIEKPRVIIQKKIGWWDTFKHRWWGQTAVPMVFDEQVKPRLDDIIDVSRSIANRIKRGDKGVYYRNLLLAGAPGTGKTMFASSLADRIGMDFVEMTGSSFFQEGAGIAAIDELFRWANNGKNLLIFIDEADSLFMRRDELKPNSEEYRLVNHFLNYLGTRSNKFMVVIATNHTHVLDEAMERRFDDYVCMPLPGLQARCDVLKLYRDEVMLKNTSSANFTASVQRFCSDQVLLAIAKRTDGLSNGHLQGIINAINTEAGGMKDGLVTAQIVDSVVQRFMDKHVALQSARCTLPRA
jgi:ATPase family associated with various cellular activities (AAA)